jgi:hypothetical protein
MKELIYNEEHIQNKIYSIRGKQIMLDSDLAERYNVETRVLNQAVKRNSKRFPIEFMFQQTNKKYELLLSKRDALRSQSVMIKNSRGKHRKYLPFVFTKQGVSMLSAVLRSNTAINTSIKIINAFVEMRKFLLSNAAVFQKFENIKNKLFQHDRNSNKIFKAIENKEITPKKGIFFNRQVFDAYLFISDIIKSVERTIVLIDNFVDETVLSLFIKNQKVKVSIYTKNISRQLNLYLVKYNSQYNPIELKKFSASHDRFLILDDKQIFHFGASLKDLGKNGLHFPNLIQKQSTF